MQPNPDNILTIEDGFFIENIKADKGLTFIARNGPKKVIIRAANPYDHVFHVTADYVKISGFTVKGAKGGAGIHLCHTDYGHISNTTISDNGCGIYLNSSSNNKIYLNNFIANTDNVCSFNSNNIWNSTELITYTYNGSKYTNYLGNYWSDYTGNDSDGDGIGDTPYNINLDTDDYPLMQPFENYS
jgi:parallel beta-helix repeat protein